MGYARLMLFGLRSLVVRRNYGPLLSTIMPLRAAWCSATVSVCSSAWSLSVGACGHCGISRFAACSPGARAEDEVRRSRSVGLAGLAGVLLAVALLLLVVAAGLAGMMQAGTHASVVGPHYLAGLLVALWWRLTRGGTVNAGVADMGLAGLAWRNAARNPTRSVITVGLIATASFLIVATSSFRLAPSDTGVGGFQLVAESSEPVFSDLNGASVRDELLAKRTAVLQGSTLFGLRLRAGDDASCNNLYQPSQPRVLGIPPDFIGHFDDEGAIPFAWSSTAAASDGEQRNPWRLLEQKRTADDDAIPTVIDMNTAFYSLKPPAMVGACTKPAMRPASRFGFGWSGCSRTACCRDL